MEFPYVAAFVGALLIVMQQVFMLIAGIHRGKFAIGAGLAGDAELERKIRRHGNLAENAAIFVVVLGFAEMLSGGGMVTTVLGVIFLAARISHAFAFSSLAGSHGKKNAPKIFILCRMMGALGTGISGVLVGLYLLYVLAS